MATRQTVEQERAKYAWGCVVKVQDTGKELGRQEEQQQITKGKSVKEAKDIGDKKARSFESEYSGLARSLPAFIQTNGLGQTLAYLLSKGENKPAKAHYHLYRHLSEWTTERLRWGKDDTLMQKLTEKSSADYRRATVETMALLVWLRRFAEAQLAKEDDHAPTR